MKNLTATEVQVRIEEYRLHERAILERWAGVYVDGYLTLLKRLGMVESNPHSEDITAKARGDCNGSD